MRINIARKQTLSRCHCYIDHNTICSETSLKCSFSRIILSAKKKESRKFIWLIAFYARVHKIIFVIHSFVRSIDRLRIAMRYSLTAKCEDVGNDLSDRFLTSLQFSTALALLSSTEIIAGWMESGLNLFLRKLSHSRNLRR